MPLSVQREEDVFNGALEIADPVERVASLDRAYEGDAELRASVEESLAACGEAKQLFTRSGEFLDACREAVSLDSALEQMDKGSTKGMKTVHDYEHFNPVRCRIGL